MIEIAPQPTMDPSPLRVVPTAALLRTYRAASAAEALGVHFVPSTATALVELFGSQTGDEGRQVCALRVAGGAGPGANPDRVPQLVRRHGARAAPARRSCRLRARSAGGAARGPPGGVHLPPRAPGRCEGGPTLNGALLADGLVDELFLSLAPKLSGGVDPLTIVEGMTLPGAVDMELEWLLESESHLFLRYALRRPVAG